MEGNTNKKTTSPKLLKKRTDPSVCSRSHLMWDQNYLKKNSLNLVSVLSLMFCACEDYMQHIDRVLTVQQPVPSCGWFHLKSVINCATWNETKSQKRHEPNKQTKNKWHTAVCTSSTPFWINHIEIKANDKNYCLQIVWILE